MAELGMHDVLIVVSGLPGSGKTSLARALSESLQLPIVSKDCIKECLFDSQQKYPLSDLGKIAISHMYEIARQPGSTILDSFFWVGIAEQDLIETGKRLVQIHCTCALVTAKSRYEARISSGNRHAAHQFVEPDWNEYAKHNRPLELDGPLHIVDTETAINLEEIEMFVRATIADF